MKKRPAKNVLPETTPHAKPALELLSDSRPKYRRRWMVLMLLVCGYWLLFYAAQPARSAYWHLLLLPDLIYQHWTGGSKTVALFDRLPIWLLSGWWLGVGYATGSMLMRLLKISQLTALEWFVFSISLGLNVLSLFTLLAGLTGALPVKALFFAVAIGLPLLEYFWMRSEQRAVQQSTAEDTPSRWFWMIVIPLTGLYLLAGATPPVEFDVREYHLQVPKEWFQAGRITFLPHNVYGNMPLGAEMHALGCMELCLGTNAWWYGALAGKQVIALFAPLTALALWAAGKRFYSAGCGTLAAVVYLSFPWIAHVSFNGLIDGVVAHYAFVAVYAMWIAGNDIRRHVLVGLLAGSAAACKYPALLLVVVPVLSFVAGRAWATSSVEERFRRAVMLKAITLAAGVAAGGAWYVKNAVFSGNPVYPLAGSVLGGATRTAEKISQWDQAHAVPRNDKEQRYSPRQAFDSLRNVFLRSQWLSPIMWPLVLLGVCGTWRNHQQQKLPQEFNNASSMGRLTLIVLAFALWMFAVWWLLSHRLDRFWLPAVPLMALLAGGAWQWANDRRTRGYLLGSVAISVLFCTLMMLTPVRTAEGSIWFISEWRWLMPLQSLRKDLSPAHAQLNSIARENETVLLVGDATPFDLAMPAFYNTCFDDCMLESLTRYRTAEEIRQAFRERKIAYVCVDWKELRRYRSPGNYGYSDYAQPKIFAQLVKSGVLLPAKWREEIKGRTQWEIYPVR